jgi:hypothetical protein
MFAWCVSGLPTRAIARKLIQAGILTPHDRRRKKAAEAAAAKAAANTSPHDADAQPAALRQRYTLPAHRWLACAASGLCPSLNAPPSLAFHLQPCTAGKPPRDRSTCKPVRRTPWRRSNNTAGSARVLECLCDRAVTPHSRVVGNPPHALLVSGVPSAPHNMPHVPTRQA